MAADDDRILSISIDDEMKQSYLLYSMSVIVARALPDVRDGLKPVQRRILRAMDDLNLIPSAQYRKSAKVTGDTSGNYHPHGDAVIYPSLVRMAQDFSSRYPLIDKQGNFGSIDGDPPAAMRYTEVRMAPLAVELLADLDKNTVDFQPNYDQRMQEPVVLPARFPNLLANGCQGIAVGMATNIPPHNLSELCDGLIMLIDNPNTTIPELMTAIPGPDFPTAALILGTKGARSAYETGRGSVVMQAKTHIEPMENGKNSIVITELPYQVNKQRLSEQIAELVKLKKVDGITGLNDFTNKEGIRVVIELRRDVQPQKVLNYLLKHTPLRSTFGVLALALVDGSPKILNLLQLLQYYIKHRQQVIRRRTQFELEKAEARLHIVEGLRRALDVIEEIIRVIRASANAAIAREQLMAQFSFSQIQAQYILDMQLRALTGLERDKLEQEWRELVALIAHLKGILGDPARVLALIREDLKEIKKKHGDARRTRILPVEADEIGDEDLIPEEEMIISITRNGYIKRVSAETYKVQRRGGRGVIGVTSREADEIAHLFIATTHHHILFFTDRGRVYRVKAYEVPQSSRTAMGMAVINLIGIEPGDRVTATVPIETLDADGYLVMGTERGEVKRTALADFKNLRANGLNAFNLEEGDSLRWVHLTSGTDDVLLVSEQGQALRFAETGLRVASRNSGGVRGMTLEGDDRVVAMEVARQGEDVLVIGKNGFGKRTNLEDFTRHHRGGKGMIVMRVTEKTGRVADVKLVQSGDRLLVSTSGGIVIRVPVSEIRHTGRAAEGVRIIKLDDGDEVRAIERVHQGERVRKTRAAADAMADPADAADPGEVVDGGDLDDAAEEGAPDVDE